MSQPPIFIHSMFRTGSTYLFSVFRRTGSYFCYQEPIHEVAWYGRSDKDILIADSLSNVELRHPPLNSPYFDELKTVHENWKHVIKERIVYEDSFPSADQRDTILYLRSLIDAAPKRPLIQDCRTSWRMSVLKAAIPGTHVFLWRNPWDQWWSCKSTPYFDTAFQLVANASSHPTVIEKLREAIDFQTCSESEIDAQFSYYTSRRLPPEKSYLLFFTLWCLAMIEGLEACDFEINIDALSYDEIYREQIIGRFSAVGVDDIDFSDADIPRSGFGSEDAAFFEPLQKLVFGWFLETGIENGLLKKIKSKTHHSLSSLRIQQSEDWSAVEELSRMRHLVRKVETREAEGLSRECERYRLLQVDFFDKASEMGQLKQLTAAKSSEIGQLQSQIEDQASVNGQLQLAVINKASEIGQLQSQIEDQASVNGQLQLAVINKASEIGQLHSQLVAGTSEIARLESQLAVQGSQISRLESEVADKVYEREKVARELEDMHLKFEQVTALMREDRERFLAGQEEWTEQNSALRKALDVERVEVGRLMRHIKFQDTEIMHIRAQVSFAETELRLVKETVSWRITSPLREVRKRLRFVIGGQRQKVAAIIRLSTRLRKISKRPISAEMGAEPRANGECSEPAAEAQPILTMDRTTSSVEAESVRERLTIHISYVTKRSS